MAWKKERSDLHQTCSKILWVYGLCDWAGLTSGSYGVIWRVWIGRYNYQYFLFIIPVYDTYKQCKYDEDWSEKSGTYVIWGTSCRLLRLCRPPGWMCVVDCCPCLRPPRPCRRLCIGQGRERTTNEIHSFNASVQRAMRADRMKILRERRRLCCSPLRNLCRRRCMRWSRLLPAFGFCPETRSVQTPCSRFHLEEHRRRSRSPSVISSGRFQMFQDLHAKNFDEGLKFAPLLMIKQFDNLWADHQVNAGPANWPKLTNLTGQLNCDLRSEDLPAHLEILV